MCVCVCVFVRVCMSMCVCVCVYVRVCWTGILITLIYLIYREERINKWRWKQGKFHEEKGKGREGKRERERNKIYAQDKYSAKEWYSSEDLLSNKTFLKVISSNLSDRLYRHKIRWSNKSKSANTHYDCHVKVNEDYQTAHLSRISIIDHHNTIHFNLAEILWDCIAAIGT